MNYSSVPEDGAYGWGRNSLVHAVYTGYKDLMDKGRDPRVDSWPLMSSMWDTTGLCMLYLVVVQWLGPKCMKYREPFDMKKPVILYNMIQTVFSGWMCLQGLKLYVYPGEYSLHCQPVDYSESASSLRILSLCYYFFLSKFVDWLDSFFFVTRKKFNQLSALHVTHHVFVPWCCWFGVKFVGGGNSMFGLMFNSGVHTVMYFYYLLSAWGVNPKYLWWKRYLTSLQMVQFVLVFLHCLQPLFFQCDYPKSITLLMIFNCILFWFFFYAFYKKSYAKPDKKKEM